MSSSFYEGNSSLAEDEENAMKILGSRIEYTETNFNIGLGN